MKRIFNKALRILLFTNGLVLLAGAMLGPIYALYVERIGGDLLDASLTGAFFALAAGITTLISGKFSDKIRENEFIVIFGYLIMGLGFFLYTIIGSITTLFLVQILIGFGEAIYSPAFDAVYSKHLDKNKSGREWGAWEGLNYFTAGIGAIIGGLIVTRFGFNTMFIIMSLLCLGSALYIYLLPRKVL